MACAQHEAGYLYAQIENMLIYELTSLCACAACGSTKPQI